MNCWKRTSTTSVRHGRKTRLSESPKRIPPETQSPLAFLPPRSSSLGCHFRTLFLGHGLETALAADLATLATYRSHVLREIHRRGYRLLWRFRRVTRRLIHDPLGKLVRITRTFALADGHRSIMP